MIHDRFFHLKARKNTGRIIRLVSGRCLDASRRPEQPEGPPPKPGPPRPQGPAAREKTPTPSKFPPRQTQRGSGGTAQGPSDGGESSARFQHQTRRVTLRGSRGPSSPVRPSEASTKRAPATPESFCTFSEGSSLGKPRRSRRPRKEAGSSANARGRGQDGCREGKTSRSRAVTQANVLGTRNHPAAPPLPVAFCACAKGSLARFSSFKERRWDKITEWELNKGSEIRELAVTSLFQRDVRFLTHHGCLLAHLSFYLFGILNALRAFICLFVCLILSSPRRTQSSL